MTPEDYVRLTNAAIEYQKKIEASGLADLVRQQEELRARILPAIKQIEAIEKIMPLSAIKQIQDINQYYQNFSYHDARAIIKASRPIIDCIRRTQSPLQKGSSPLAQSSSTPAQKTPRKFNVRKVRRRNIRKAEKQTWGCNLSRDDIKDLASAITFMAPLMDKDLAIAINLLAAALFFLIIGLNICRCDKDEDDCIH